MRRVSTFHHVALWLYVLMVVGAVLLLLSALS